MEAPSPFGMRSMASQGKEGRINNEKNLKIPRPMVEGTSYH